jgi:hypothetical protein
MIGRLQKRLARRNNNSSLSREFKDGRHKNSPSLHQTVSVTVPFYACPGEVFQTYINDRIARIHSQCPADNIAGEMILKVFIPPESFIHCKIQ